MAGTPFRGLSPPELAGRALGGTLSGRRVVVRNLSKPGESILPQVSALERWLWGRARGVPGAVLIYSGSNDHGRPAAAPTWWLVKEALLERSLLSRALWDAGERRSLLPRVRSLFTYERHLRRAIERSLESGLVPVLSTVVSNASGVEPGLLAGSGSSTGRAGEMLAEGMALEARGRHREALRLYEGASSRRLGAYLLFRAGKCYEALGEPEPARRRFLQAIDYLAADNFNRATRYQNETIRGLAREYGVPLVDAVGLFEARSTSGRESALFVDGHHPSLLGHAILAEGFADALAARFGGAVERRLSRAPDPEQALAYPLADRLGARLYAGRWLLTASSRHLAPEERLSLAEERFREALRLAPEAFSARLGLAIAEAARRSAFLRDAGTLRWLGRMKVFYGSRFRVSPWELTVLLRRLRQAGVAEGSLRGVSAAHARTGGDHRGWAISSR